MSVARWRVAAMRALWRRLNPLVMRLARRTSVWCVVETRGRRTGLARRTPVAMGRDGRTVWIVAAQGAHAAYVGNIVADPAVRVRIRDRWYAGRAELVPAGTPIPDALGWYARSATRLWPQDWRLVRIELV